MTHNLTNRQILASIEFSVLQARLKKETKESILVNIQLLKERFSAIEEDLETINTYTSAILEVMGED